MITGINTSVGFEDQNFHVQTEDRGREDPVIESLIYQGGAVLGSKKTSYKEFLESADFDEAKLRRMLESQHYAIVRAISSGRVTERRRARLDAKLPAHGKPAAAAPHVELLSDVVNESESPHTMRIRIVETPGATPDPHAKVSVEVFGAGLPSKKLRGVTDAEGYLNLKIEIPKDHRVSAAMLFRVDRRVPVQEMKVLVVKSPSR